MVLIFALLATWSFAPSALAQQPSTSTAVSEAEHPTLEELISQAVEDHDRLLGARADADGLRETARETLGAWFPSLDVSTSILRERIAREGGDPVTLPSQELTVSVTQLLWDFGATNGTVESARLAHVQSEIAFFRTRQELIVEAVQAYANLLRSVDVLAFARQSEENIRVQTGLEEIRITAGSGLSTDLLQAKTQLAGAQARRVDAEGALDLALNRYRAVYGDVPPNLDVMPGIAMDRSDLPNDVEGAVALAFQSNPEIREAGIGIAISKQDRRSTFSDFLPTVEMVGESKALDNDGGAVGTRTEHALKLEMSWPFNLGFTAINTLRASQSQITSASRVLADLRRTLEERVRNAWKQLETAQTRSKFLFDQADIARAFLDVAIEERRLGQRSLIDVLSGETALINAQSDAISAETEVTLATLELLAATGALAYGHIRERERPDRLVEFKRDVDLGPDLGGEEAESFDPSLLGDGADEGGVFDPNAIFQPPPTDEDGVLDPGALIENPEVVDPNTPDATIIDPTAVPSDEMPAETLPLETDGDEPAYFTEPTPAVEPENDSVLDPVGPANTTETQAPAADGVPEPEPTTATVPAQGEIEPVEPVLPVEPAAPAETEQSAEPDEVQTNLSPSAEEGDADSDQPDAGAQPAQPSEEAAPQPETTPANVPSTPGEPVGEDAPAVEMAPPPLDPEPDTGIPDLFQESLNGGTSFDVQEPPPPVEQGEGEEGLESPLLKWAQ